MKLPDNFRRFLKDLFIGEDEEQETRPRPARDVLEQAKIEWQNAQNIFSEVNDPELIEFAVYNLKAAENRYMYLLNQVKKPKETVANATHWLRPSTRNGQVTKG